MRSGEGEGWWCWWWWWWGVVWMQAAVGPASRRAVRTGKRVAVAVRRKGPCRGVRSSTDSVTCYEHERVAGGSEDTTHRQGRDGRRWKRCRREMGRSSDILFSTSPILASRIHIVQQVPDIRATVMYRTRSYIFVCIASFTCPNMSEPNNQQIRQNVGRVPDRRTVHRAFLPCPRKAEIQQLNGEAKISDTQAGRDRRPGSAEEATRFKSAKSVNINTATLPHPRSTSTSRRAY